MNLAIDARLADLASQARIPRSTYRLQFGQHLSFRDAQALAPYLDRLGISDVYASPILQACSSGSSGYDICDHSRLDPSLGGEEDFDGLADALRERGMGLVLDTVPNHMGIGSAANAWWMDVLENGPSSLYAGYFDIDWVPVKRELENKLLLPILEDQYGNVLESGKLRLTYDKGAFSIRYYDHAFPVAPGAYDRILRHVLDRLLTELGAESEHVVELQSILTAIGYLPSRAETEPARIRERAREKEIIKRRIEMLASASPEAQAAIGSAMDRFNGMPGNPASFNLLDELIDAQAYRLAFWRVAADEINYRRFFDVNSLAAIRVELPQVLLDTHSVIMRLLAEGRATGLRIDHPDGLWDPAGYFRAIQTKYAALALNGRLVGGEAGEEELEIAVGEWMAARARQQIRERPWPLYVVAEKILSGDERLPDDWAVYGTTGYDFLNLVNGLFVDRAGRRTLDQMYARLAHTPSSLRDLANSAKKMTMLISLTSEINSLGHQLERLAERTRAYRDFTLGGLIFALREVIAGLPVYRTYINPISGHVPERDARYIQAATAEARRRNPRTSPTVFEFIGDTVLLRNWNQFRPEDQIDLVNWVNRFQQMTGPMMAKGLEDTAFYQYNRLVSLNEVGGEPERFGVSVDEFHRQNAARLKDWPHSMLTTSTHDTKRGEDVRMRIDVVSEMPDEWRKAVARWKRLNAGKKADIDGAPAPDSNDEYLFYQTLVGAWPGEMQSHEFVAFRDRLVAYMHKAAKEAKVHTSWVNPNEAYDKALQEFIMRVLPENRDAAFLSEFIPWQRRVAYFGYYNSLSQTLLKLTAPGVPDIYQGAEMWDLSLVDPDNRRPVDYAPRCAALDKFEASSPESTLDLARSLLSHMPDGRIKLYTIYRALGLRKARPDLFERGRYIPLRAEGTRSEYVCVFARVLEGQVAITLAPRLYSRLLGGRQEPPLGESVWDNSWVPLPAHLLPGDGAGFRDVFTEQRVPVATGDAGPMLRLSEVFLHWPIALLVSP